MNRSKALILALMVGTSVGACASAGAAGGGPSGAEAQKAEGYEPEENDFTEEANRSLGLALIQQDSAQKQVLYQTALQAAQQSIAEEPTNPLGWFLAGQAHANLGDFVAADSAFDRAVELYPAYAPEIEPEREAAWIAAYNQGIEAYQANDLATAIALMEKADVIYQGRPEARLNLGAFYANDNQPEKAIEAFRGALEILNMDHSGIDSATVAGWMDRKKETQLNLAQLLAATGKDQEAEAVYREYLAQNPDDLEARTRLAAVLAKQGKSDEAGTVYGDLLGRDDLGDSDYLMIGVGFFQSEQYDKAAEAFSKAAVANPYSRDAHYNLAQALFVHADELEEARDSAQGAEAQALEAQLVQVHKDLAHAAEKALEFDPYNRNLVIYVARAYETLSRLSSDQQEKASYQAKVREALQRHQQTPLEVNDLAITPSEGQVEVRGTVKNLQLEPGALVTLRVTILSNAGSTIGTQDVRIAAPAQESSTPFDAVVLVNGEMAGWKYEVIR
ncbi:MAG TPA: tetratricopeptide repeat protein [Longimicrobiales bacterium]